METRGAHGRQWEAMGGHGTHGGWEGGGLLGPRGVPMPPHGSPLWAPPALLMGLHVTVQGMRCKVGNGLESPLLKDSKPLAGYVSIRRPRRARGGKHYKHRIFQRWAKIKFGDEIGPIWVGFF